MKPTPTPDVIDSFIIAKESADRRLYGFHNLGRHFILDGTTEVWFTASDDYEVGHAAMMAQLERLRVDAALSAALSVQPAEAVVGEPVAWRWSFDRGDTWNYGTLKPGKMRFGDPDIIEPLYAAPSAPDGWQSIETAPKDGTVCIVAFPLYNDVSNGLKVTAARFYEAEYLGDRTSGWEQLLDSDGVMTIWEPTHWRPLPPPPGESS